MNDVGPTENGALIDQIQALRSENQRQRALLGLDQPSRHQITHPWGPRL